MSLCLPITRQAVAATTEDNGLSETQKKVPFIIQTLSQTAMSVQTSLENRGGHVPENCRGSGVQECKGVEALGSVGQCFAH